MNAEKFELISSEKLMDFLEGLQPKLEWQMDKELLNSIKRLMDCTGKCIWSPHIKDEFHKKPGKLFNYPIEIIPMPGIYLKVTIGRRSTSYDFYKYFGFCK